MCHELGLVIQTSLSTDLPPLKKKKKRKRQYNQKQRLKIVRLCTQVYREWDLQQMESFPNINVQEDGLSSTEPFLRKENLSSQPSLQAAVNSSNSPAGPKSTQSQRVREGPTWGAEWSDPFGGEQERREKGYRSRGRASQNLQEVDQSGPSQVWDCFHRSSASSVRQRSRGTAN